MPALERIKQLHHLLDDIHQLQLDRTLAELLKAPKCQDARNLSHHEHKVFSQSGEDGIIAEIFKRIGTTNRKFVECAPGTGVECNTAYLLILGWTGLWIEADPKHVRAINATFSKPLKDGTLILQSQFATAENINSILKKASMPQDFDLLSIDIDRNDFWIWQKIEAHKPRVVVIEYNAVYPPGCKWVVEYSANAAWDGTSNAGASLTALEQLGAEKGYRLVGCTLAGTNAFFVREDLLGDHFQPPFTSEHHYEPARYYLTSRKGGHPRSAPQNYAP